MKRSYSTVWCWENLMLLGLLAVFAALAIIGFAGCGANGKAMRRQARDTTVKAIPTVAVVVFTWPLGMGVQAVATVGTLVITDLFVETASLSSGETTGEGALKAEIERWKGQAVQATRAASLAQNAKDWLVILIWLSVAGFVAWFLFRNRHNIRDLGLYNGLKHSIFGGGVGKAIAK